VDGSWGTMLRSLRVALEVRKANLSLFSFFILLELILLLSWWILGFILCGCSYLNCILWFIGCNWYVGLCV